MKKKITIIIIFVVLTIVGLLCALFIKPNNSNDSSQNSISDSSESYSSIISSDDNSDLSDELSSEISSEDISVPSEEISSEISSEDISIPSEEISSEISSEDISVPSEEISSEISSEENSELTEAQIYDILLDAYYNSIEQQYVFTDYLSGSLFEKVYYTPDFVYREDTQMKAFFYDKDDISYKSSCGYDDMYFVEFPTDENCKTLSNHLYSYTYFDHGAHFSKTTYNDVEYYSYRSLFGSIVLIEVEDNLYKSIIELNGDSIYSELKISYEKKEYKIPVPVDIVNGNFGDSNEIYVYSSQNGTYISYSFYNNYGEVVFNIKSDTNIKFNYNIPLQVKVTDVSGFDYSYLNDTFFEKLKEYFTNNPYITLTLNEDFTYTSSINFDIIEKEIGAYLTVNRVYEEGLHLISSEDGIFVEKSFYNNDGLLIYKISFSSKDRLYKGIYHDLTYQEITYIHPDVSSDDHQQVLDYLNENPTAVFCYEEEIINLFVYPLEDIISSFNNK